MYVLRTGCQWKALPKERFGSASAVHKRFLEWEAAGVFEDIWRAGLHRTLCLTPQASLRLFASLRRTAGCATRLCWADRPSRTCARSRHIAPYDPAVPAHCSMWGARPLADATFQNAVMSSFEWRIARRLPVEKTILVFPSFTRVLSGFCTKSISSSV